MNVLLAGVIFVMSSAALMYLYVLWELNKKGRSKKFIQAVCAFCNRGEYEDVVLACDMRLKRFPTDLAYLWLKCLSLQQLEKFEEAKELLETILEVTEHFDGPTKTQVLKSLEYVNGKLEGFGSDGH